MADEQGNKQAAATCTREMLPSLPRHAFTKASPSQINTFRDCERKWYFNKVLKLWEPSSAAQRQGTAVHTEMEELVLGTRTGDKLCKEAAELAQYLPEDSGKVIKPTKEGVPFEDFIRQPLMNYTLVEPAFTLTLPEWPVPVGGLIDRIYVPPVAGQAIEIVDYKTTGNLAYVPLAENVMYDPQKVIYSEVGFLHPHFEDVRFTLLYTKKLKGKTDTPASRRVSVVTNKHNRVGKEEITRDLNRMVEASGLDLQDTKVNTASCGKYNGCPYAHLCDKGGQQEKTVMGIFDSMANKQTKIDQAAAQPQGGNPLLSQNPGTVFGAGKPADQPQAAAPASANPFAKQQGNPFANPAAAQPQATAPAEQPAAKPAGLMPPEQALAELKSVPASSFPAVTPPKDGKPVDRPTQKGRRCRAEIFRDRILTLIHSSIHSPGTKDPGVFFWKMLTPEQAQYIGTVQQSYPLPIEFPETLDGSTRAPVYIADSLGVNTKTLSEILGKDEEAKEAQQASVPAPGQSVSVFGNAAPAPAAPTTTTNVSAKVWDGAHAAPAPAAPTAHPVADAFYKAAEALVGNATVELPEGPGRHLFLLFVGCVPLKSTAVDLHSWLAPLKADIEKRSGLPYWNLQEFGKGKQELAARVKAWIESGVQIPNLYATGLDSALEETLAVLSEYAIDVIRRC